MAAPIAAISLDVGNTLLFPDPSIEGIYRGVAERHGLPLADSFSGDVFSDAWRAEQSLRKGELLYGTSHAEALRFWMAVNRRIFPEAEVPSPVLKEFVEDLYYTFASGHVWRVAHDLEALVRACRECGVRTALLSNWDLRLRSLLSDLDLIAKVDEVLISAEYGIEKPHPRIFATLAELLNLRAGEILHVGDTWEDDVVGATEAGFQAAWLNPEEREIPDESLPVYVVCSLGDLIPLVQQGKMKRHG